MTWESIALGALCVSQGLMWIRSTIMYTADVERIEETSKLLHTLADDAGAAAHQSTIAASRAYTADQNIITVRDELRAMIAALPRKRNRRVRELPPSAPLAPLKRDKRQAPSPDPIGQVST